MADFVYNGFWFSPEAAFTRKCLELSQETVTGMVTVQIFKGNGNIISTYIYTYYKYYIELQNSKSIFIYCSVIK